MSLKWAKPKLNFSTIRSLPLDFPCSMPPLARCLSLYMLSTLLSTFIEMCFVLFSFCFLFTFAPRAVYHSLIKVTMDLKHYEIELLLQRIASKTSKIYWENYPDKKSARMGYGWQNCFDNDVDRVVVGRCTMRMKMRMEIKMWKWPSHFSKRNCSQSG